MAQQKVKVPDSILVCVHDSCHCKKDFKERLRLSDIVTMQLKSILAKTRPQDFDNPDNLQADTCVIDEIL